MVQNFMRSDPDLRLVMRPLPLRHLCLALSSSVSSCDAV